ncbi:MAG: hypothetical protein ABUT39_08530 [Acidobacteriota bacterium]
MKKKKDIDRDRLFARIEALPPETRAGIVGFLELVMSLESVLGEYAAPVNRSEEAEKDIHELRGILAKHLQGGPPQRTSLVLEVVACAEKANALGQEDSARLLLQVGLLVAAGDERLASFIFQDAACNAALEVVRVAAR